jgi:hypothetical protein
LRNKSHGETHHEIFYAAIAASGLILGAQSALAAADDQLDVSELTCEQFTN